MSSCTNQPIFAAIEQEIKLKNFSVRGPIASLLELNNTVYAATPEAVFSKSKWSSGEWSSIGSPGSFIQSLATDGTNLFAATTEGVYYYNGGWSKVPGGGSIVMIGGNNGVFGYDEKGKTVYKITTGGINTPLSISGTFIGGGGNYFAFTDGLYTAGSTTKVAGSPSGVKSVCGGDGTTVFVLAGSTVYHYDGASWSSQAVSLSSPLSISYFKYGTSEERVLVGGKGYGEVKLASGIHTLAGAYYIGAGESGSTTPPSVNAQYTSSIGAHSLMPVMAVDRGGGNYTVFAGVNAGSIYRNTGLWGFYSNGNVEWNRE